MRLDLHLPSYYTTLNDTQVTVPTRRANNTARSQRSESSRGRTKVVGREGTRGMTSRGDRMSSLVVAAPLPAPKWGKRNPEGVSEPRRAASACCLHRMVSGMARK